MGNYICKWTPISVRLENPIWFLYRLELLYIDTLYVNLKRPIQKLVYSELFNKVSTLFKIYYYVSIVENIKTNLTWRTANNLVSFSHILYQQLH